MHCKSKYENSCLYQDSKTTTKDAYCCQLLSKLNFICTLLFTYHIHISFFFHLRSITLINQFHIRCFADTFFSFLQYVFPIILNLLHLQFSPTSISNASSNPDLPVPIHTHLHSTPNSSHINRFLIQDHLSFHSKSLKFSKRFHSTDGRAVTAVSISFRHNAMTISESSHNPTTFRVRKVNRK